MPEYNPNSVWTSKKDPFTYAPKEPRPLPSREEEPDEPSHDYIWWWAGGLFTLVVVLGILFFVYRPPVGPNVNIGFMKPDQVLAGEPFPLSITVANASQDVLKNAVLRVTLPDNLSFVGQSAGQRSMEQSVGDVGPGSVYKFNGDGGANLVAAGDLGGSNLRHVDVTLSYSTNAAPNTVFQTTGGADIYIQGPAITIAFTPPTSVVSGQDFTMTVSYANTSNFDFSDAVLSMQFPPVFSFTSSTIAPQTPAHDSWDLGALPAGASSSIVITGNVVGPENASYPFNIDLKGTVVGNAYDIAQGTGNIAVAVSPLTITVVSNNDPNYVAHPGETLDYVLSYRNGSSIGFQNVAITAVLAGTMFDLSSLQTSGSFSSLNNTVTWNPANTPALANVAPGQTGTVEFRIRTKNSYPIVRSYDKNFALDVTTQIASPTVPPGTAASSTVSAAKAETLVGGKMTLAANGYWRDAAAGVLNSGPYPPKVNQATEYTIHWVITNYATDAGSVTVSSTLQSGTMCTGTIKSNMSTAPVCDPATGAVTWTIPTVPATMGVVGPPAEAIIQVKNTPAVNQVNRTVTLMGPTTLTATDLFTSSTLTAAAPEVTTLLPNDKTVSGGGAVVQ